jgi:hypothetical protein
MGGGARLDPERTRSSRTNLGAGRHMGFKLALRTRDCALFGRESKRTPSKEADLRLPREGVVGWETHHDLDPSPQSPSVKHPFLDPPRPHPPLDHHHPRSTLDPPKDEGGPPASPSEEGGKEGPSSSNGEDGEDDGGKEEEREGEEKGSARLDSEEGGGSGTDPLHPHVTI